MGTLMDYADAAGAAWHDSGTATADALADTAWQRAEHYAERGYRLAAARCAANDTHDAATADAMALAAAADALAATDADDALANAERVRRYAADAERTAEYAARRARRARRHGHDAMMLETVAAIHSAATDAALLLGGNADDADDIASRALLSLAANPDADLFTSGVGVVRAAVRQWATAERMRTAERTAAEHATAG